MNSLLFLSQVTRPDMAYTINYVYRFLSNSIQIKRNLVKKILLRIKKKKNNKTSINNYWLH